MQRREKTLLIRFDVLEQEAQPLPPPRLLVVAAHLQDFGLDARLGGGLDILHVFLEERGRTEPDELAGTLGLRCQSLETRYIVVEEHSSVPRRLLVRDLELVAGGEVVLPAALRKAILDSSNTAST